MNQDTARQPIIIINNYQLDVLKELTYFGSTVTDNLSMGSEISWRIGRATSTLARLSSTV